MYTRLFDDILSFAHLLLGFIAGIMPLKYSLFIVVAFTLYEIVENRLRGEPKGSLIGDTLEFFIGYVLGLLTIIVFL